MVDVWNLNSFTSWVTYTLSCSLGALLQPLPVVLGVDTPPEDTLCPDPALAAFVQGVSVALLRKSLAVSIGTHPTHFLC